MANDEEALKRRYREFLDLMPLAVAIAGLAPAEGTRNFTPDQMELRGTVLMNAYKVAKQIARENLKTP
jgi:hypothetical protein